MIVEVKDDRGRIITLLAVTLEDNQTRLTVTAQTPGRTRKVFESFITLSPQDAEALTAGMGRL